MYKPCAGVRGGGGVFSVRVNVLGIVSEREEKNTNGQATWPGELMVGGQTEYWIGYQLEEEGPWADQRNAGMTF